MEIDNIHVLGGTVTVIVPHDRTDEEIELLKENIISKAGLGWAGVTKVIVKREGTREIVPRIARDVWGPE